MTKNLVTGGAGFIGYRVAKHLSDLNQEVVLVDNFLRGQKDKSLTTLLERSNVTFVECDLTDSSFMERLGGNYDHVYHFAAINGTKNFYERPQDVLRINLLTTINILDWFITSNSKKILFSSSSETYSGTKTLGKLPVPTPEDVPLCIEDISNPRWSYAGSKIAGELLFLNYARAYNITMSIVRYHNIYGPRMGYDHVIPEFCQKLKNKNGHFSMMGGSETRAFCFIEDAVLATEAVMKSDKTDGEIIHIGNHKEEITIDSLAKLMIDLHGSNPTIIKTPPPTGTVSRRCPNVDKLKEMTGFEAAVSLSEGLKITMDWYLR